LGGRFDFDFPVPVPSLGKPLGINGGYFIVRKRHTAYSKWRGGSLTETEKLICAQVGG